MRLVKSGRVKWEMPTSLECPNCHSEYDGITKEDFIYNEGYDSGREYEPAYLSWMCNVCSYVNRVNNVPEYVVEAFK